MQDLAVRFGVRADAVRHAAHALGGVLAPVLGGDELDVELAAQYQSLREVWCCVHDVLTFLSCGIAACCLFRREGLFHLNLRVGRICFCADGLGADSSGMDWGGTGG